MSNIQGFDSEQAITVSKKIKKQAGAASTAMKTVETEIRSMESWWKGESSKAFSAQFEELKPSLTKLVQLVEDISIQLESVAKAKEESELNIAKAIRR